MNNARPVVVARSGCSNTGPSYPSNRRINFGFVYSAIILTAFALSCWLTLVDAVDENASCDALDDNKTAWKWEPSKEHPCTVTRMTYKEFLGVFGNRGIPPLYHQPLVITSNSNIPDRNANFYQRTSRANITASFPPNFQVTLSSSNSFSAHRRTIPLKQYLDEITTGETSPDQLSNETWYFFGETFTSEWTKLLDTYELPQCHTCTSELTALAFGIGNLGSGVQWHTHGPGFSQALHGRKHWVLTPPDQQPIYHPDETSRHWMEYTYATLPVNKRPYECTLQEGDIIYFPDRWHHATINLDAYTSFVSAFTTEHLA